METNSFKEARLKQKLSLTKAAEKLSITKTYLSLIENQHKDPSLQLIIKMASIYNVTICSLIMQYEKINKI
jgi:transcriptional regulator with XRE-family HTH domain